LRADAGHDRRQGSGAGTRSVSAVPGCNWQRRVWCAQHGCRPRSRTARPHRAALARRTLAAAQDGGDGPHEPAQHHED
jgi:hypothetical protein